MQVALLDETANPESFLSDPSYCCEEKLNGRRMLLSKRGGVVRAYSRNGREYVAPLAVITASRASPDDWTRDGELTGEVFTPFDVLDYNGNDLRSAPYTERLALTGTYLFPFLRRAEREADKRALLALITREGGEGVVFKRLDAPYVPGSTTYGVKFKLYSTRTVRVGAVDLGRCSFEMFDSGGKCGRCAFSFSGNWPKTGELWEVRHDGESRHGRLLRPQLLMRRDDLETLLT